MGFFFLKLQHILPSWMIEPLLRLIVKTALILGLLKSLAVKTVCYIVQKTKICPELIILSLTRV